MTKVNCIEPISRVYRILSSESILPDNLAQKKTQIIKLTLHSTFFAVTSLCLAINAVTASNTRNYTALIHTICIFIPLANLFVKVVIAIRKRQYFVSLLEHAKSDVFNNHSEKLNYYVRFLYRVSEVIWKYYTIAIAAYVFIAAILPFVINTRMVIPPPFHMGQYLILYKLLHIAICIYMSINAVCFDVLFMYFLGLCIAQLCILEDRLVHVYEDASEIYQSKKLGTIFLYEENIIRDCIILHEAITQCVEKLNLILSFPLFIQYFFGCFVICNLILQLTIMSEGIIHACCTSKWYKLSKRSKQSIMILMERAKRPIAVQLFKLVSMSLGSLSVIIRWSYSLFALIKAQYNSKQGIQ